MDPQTNPPLPIPETPVSSSPLSSSPPPSSPPRKKVLSFGILALFFIFCCFIASGYLYVGYQFVLMHTSQKPRATSEKIVKKKTVAVKPKSNTAAPDSSAPLPEKNYTISYTIPSGWHPLLWNITDAGVQSAIIPPDYTSIADPEPQTGMAIIFYEFPGSVSDMKNLRPIVEQTENGLQHISQTTIAGYPAWYAIFQNSDTDRVLYDYHILKDHDHWIIRLIFPGTSLQNAQNEAGKYNYQITAFLQSVQFKTSVSQ